MKEWLQNIPPSIETIEGKPSLIYLINNGFKFKSMVIPHRKQIPIKQPNE